MYALFTHAMELRLALSHYTGKRGPHTYIPSPSTKEYLLHTTVTHIHTVTIDQRILTTYYSDTYIPSPSTKEYLLHTTVTHIHTITIDK